MGTSRCPWWRAVMERSSGLSLPEARSQDIRQVADVSGVGCAGRPGRTWPGWGRVMAVAVGHQRERARIRTLIEAMPAGRGGVVLVEGEAGIGKSHLVLGAEADARAAIAGVQVLEGRADELERHRPFGALTECFGIRRWSAGQDEPEPHDPRATVARLLAGELPPGADVPVFPETPLLEYRVLEALVALFEGRCAQGPVLVVVEDIQWADPSSLLTVNRMAREAVDLPALIVCTRRPTPASDE